MDGMPPPLLKHKAVTKAWFCRWARPVESPLCLPFALVHIWLLYGSLFEVDTALDLLGEELVAEFHITPRHVSGLLLLLIPVTLIVQVVICATCYWNARLRAFFFFTQTKDIADATHIFIHVSPSHGSDCITTLQKSEGRTSFNFHNRIYRWQAEQGTFVKPVLPVKLPAKAYKGMLAAKQPWWSLQACEGAAPPASAATRSALLEGVYGKNKFDIPLPEFKELMVEHATSPFFLFQMLCVVLWLLDEYWYTAVLTGIMLCVFESTVVHQRLRNMDHLRDIDSAPLKCTVLRAPTPSGMGATESVISDMLLPGDQILMQKHLVSETLPADILLIEGSVIANESMLTGETTPVMKENIQTRDDAEVIDLTSPDHKIHVLFAGTKMLQVTTGTVGVVLRTGFETSQGVLVRKIVATSTNRTIAGGAEAFYFIGCLLVFALLASGHVLYHGLRDPARSRYKLLLSCTMIITSVVPPELPMELAIAVNMSFMLLHKLKIFCSEPAKITDAGALDVCCFDKTGTLTADIMEFVGVKQSSVMFPLPEPPIVSPSSSAETIPVGTQPPLSGEDSLSQPSSLSLEAQLVLTGCHSVALLERSSPGLSGKEMSGDSMEVAAVRALGWAPSESAGLAHFEKKRGLSLTVVSRHAFSSTLQRMSCVVAVNKPAGGSDSATSLSGLATREEWRKLSRSALAHSVFAVAKGSPESMAKIMNPDTIPASYESAYATLGENGFRVIALALRPLQCDASYAKKLKRSDVEADLIFVGFAVFRCPIRADACPTVKALQGASQQVVMITGDHRLTAAWVAKQTGIAVAPHAFLQPTGGWALSDGTVLPSAEVSPAMFDLVASGDAMNALGDPSWLSVWVTRIKVWARCNPEQKEQIIKELRRQGKVTLMCGDGTNDVGALTQAHVGVGLLAGCQTAKPIEVEQKGPPPHPLSIPEPLPDDMGILSILKWRMRENKRQKQYMEHLRKEMQEMQRLGKRRFQGIAPPPPPPALPTDMEGEGMYAPVVQIGDASLAAPFTARNSSTAATCHLLRLGRCTLATTMQMYRIMALNCLTTAFAFSVLATERVKYSDTQMTVTSLFVAVCFLCTSRGTPLPTLSKRNPIRSVFSPVVLLTIALQFAAHCYHLAEASNIAYAESEAYTSKMAAFESGGEVVNGTSPLGYNRTLILPDSATRFDDATFAPCLLNSLVFMLSTWQLVLIFVLNYQGRPFMTALHDNTWLLFSLLALAVIVLECTFQLTPLAYYMEVVDLSLFPEVQSKFAVLLATNAALPAAAEAVLQLVGRFL